jgi:uncharacterized protein (DUF2141 family)
MINNMHDGLQKLNLKLSYFAGLGMALIFLSVSPAAFAADSTSALSLQVRGFSHDRGRAVANLFRETDDVLKPDTAYRRVQAEIHEGRSTLSFTGLPYGKYAVSVFHDENGNGTLDHNFFRFPAEPLGFSNHFRLGLFSGMPSFEKLQFQFSADTAVMEMSLK